jgi:hypothetical protein
MKTPDEQPALRALVPLLDEALLSLREKDRAALLLRFYERQSLRDVGISLGVGEDAAQKRVGSALEKLSHFFQRRGFRTATASVTAAALQQTTASASAATATAVLHGALSSAPPALTGIAAALARLAALSKTQVAALCLIIAAMPVGWQWHERRVAQRTAGHFQSQLDSVRLEQLRLETEIQRLTESSDRLRVGLARAGEGQRLPGEAAGTALAWKDRLRRLLTADDYHWPDDSPFVRIPKGAVSSIRVTMPINSSGVIKPEARELLGLSPADRAAVEERLREHCSDVGRMMDAALYETNRAAFVQVPSSAFASRVFVVPALGDAAKQSGEELIAGLKSLLGEERWRLVDAELQTYGTLTLRRVLGLDADHESEEIAVWVSRYGGNVPTVGYGAGMLSGSFTAGGEPLASVLLPEGAMNGRSVVDGLHGANLPDPVITRIVAWLREQAEVHSNQPSDR